MTEFKSPFKTHEDEMAEVYRTLQWAPPPIVKVEKVETFGELLKKLLFWKLK